MLPAWATVAITLGASALTAIAALGGAARQGGTGGPSRCETARSKPRTISRPVRAKRSRVYTALNSTGLSDMSAVWAVVPEVERVFGEADARLGRVHLLFGVESPAGVAARDAVGRLRAAVEDLKPPVSNLRRAEDARGGAAELLDDFNAAALEAIKSL